EFASDMTHAAATGSATASGTISGITVSVRAAGATTATAVSIDNVKVEDGDDAAAVNRKIVAAFNDKLDQTGLYATIDGANIKFESLRAGQDVTVGNAGTLAGGTGLTYAGGAMTVPTTNLA